MRQVQRLLWRRNAILQRRRRLLFGLILITATLFYCVRQSQGTAVAALLAAAPPGVQIEVLGAYPAPWRLGQFFLYRRQASATAFADYRYAPVKRDLWGRWRVGAGGKCSSAAGEQATALVNFHAHYLWYTYGYDEMVSYSVICGRVDSTQIQTVTVIWADGEVTAAPVAQGWFVVLRPARQAACQLQLLDQAKTVIQVIALAQIDFAMTDATTPLPVCTLY